MFQGYVSLGMLQNCSSHSTEEVSSFADRYTHPYMHLIRNLPWLNLSRSYIHFSSPNNTLQVGV